MLKKLSIQNYAIIDELEIDFNHKLNIVTGETGAGKSIIVGALGLILGERADTSVLVNQEKKCVVEGIFISEKRKEVKDFLKTNELDAEEELVIRREIAPNGKSRAFVNDTPVVLEQLRFLSSLLVDLHQQFDTLQLGQIDFQRQVLDALAGHASLINEYQVAFANWKTFQKAGEELIQQKLQFDKEADYNRFQFNELDEAGFRENELEETDAELKLLTHAEEIKNTLVQVVNELKENENPLVQQLKVLVQQLQHYVTFHPELPTILQRFQSVQIELQDIADEVDSISNKISFDAKKAEQLDARLSTGYKLLKKHGVKSTGELLQIRKELENKLQAVLSIDEAILQMEKEVATAYKKANQLATEISDGRKKQAKPLEEKVNKLLAQVGMPNAKLKVEIKEEEQLNAHGKNSIEFLFDANKSGQFLPVKKVASGGELSRLMLCIKSQVAKRIDLPTMIFDEIDTGISGEAARQVGLIMKALTEKRQLICITHQPQIAGKADAHFFVYKEIVKNLVKTNIRPLSMEERITTIAKMLSGEKPTAAALENAREMVAN
ncbi:MAG TPA: DNA repair protein RecN [Chitinophagaceae bacterium]|nr:DNA repair protein RecN [Chitinophagaceae bacterium]